MRFPQRLWLCVTPTDMRKSYDGLCAIVRGEFNDDPLTGEGFVFINRRRTQLKCLYFDSGGYCVWAKRLERGLFAHRPKAQQGRVALSQTEFTALLDGLDVTIERRRKRYAPHSIAQ